MINLLTGLALVGAAASAIACAIAKLIIENEKCRIADSSLILHSPFYIFNSFQCGGVCGDDMKCDILSPIKFRREMT